MPWHLYLMAGMYVVAGTLHFVFPKAYLRIMPNYLPYPKFLVYSSGVIEILLGIALCWPFSKDLAIYGIIAMLILFLPVHLYMLSGKDAAAGVPKWVLWLRLPLQIGLMYWAFWYLQF